METELCQEKHPRQRGKGNEGFEKGDWFILWHILCTAVFSPGRNQMWELHAGTVDSTVALQQEGFEFKSWSGVFLHGVCMFSLWMCGYYPGTPASKKLEIHDS
ncbi:hypothetical protein GOODEAATRI_012835 [Goodea atripinnis]|uniref:Uncharacterized protein n=1 Tax=Goodea atripinnis TaxID=208336 RepID=A0ABV0MRL8_9TELE